MANKIEDPAWLTNLWKTWLAKTLAAQQMSFGKLAEAAGCNASYVSHMVNKGTIPRRAVAERVGVALGKKNEALLMAGYIPHRGFIEALTKAMRGK